MIIESIDTEKEIFIVAEIGNNHEGNIETAKKLIDKAAEAGVHAVKFQTFITEHYVGRSNPERFKLLKSFELGFDNFRKLSEYAKSKGLVFFSTPLDIESAVFLNEIVPLFKIASGDNTFYPLIDFVIETNKPFIISTGLLDMDQIEHLRKYINEQLAKKKLKNKYAFLHCVCSYPVPDNEANLLVITEFLSRFDCTIGYSDHTIGIDASVAAATLGARIIEKHFTLNKNFSGFRDHKLSADPDEMTEMVRKIKKIETLIGEKFKKKALCEMNIEHIVRRSVSAKHNLSAGHILTINDLIWTRPSGGIPPGIENQIIGKKTSGAIGKGEIINMDSLTLCAE